MDALECRALHRAWAELTEIPETWNTWHFPIGQRIQICIKQIEARMGGLHRRSTTHECKSRLRFLSLQHPPSVTMHGGRGQVQESSPLTYPASRLLQSAPPRHPRCRLQRVPEESRSRSPRHRRAQSNRQDPARVQLRPRRQATPQHRREGGARGAHSADQIKQHASAQGRDDRDRWEREGKGARSSQPDRGLGRKRRGRDESQARVRERYPVQDDERVDLDTRPQCRRRLADAANANYADERIGLAGLRGLAVAACLLYELRKRFASRYIPPCFFAIPRVSV